MSAASASSSTTASEFLALALELKLHCIVLSQESDIYYRLLSYRLFDHGIAETKNAVETDDAVAGMDVNPFSIFTYTCLAAGNSSGRLVRRPGPEASCLCSLCTAHCGRAIAAGLNALVKRSMAQNKLFSAALVCGSKEALKFCVRLLLGPKPFGRFIIPSAGRSSCRLHTTHLKITSQRRPDVGLPSSSAMGRVSFRLDITATPLPAQHLQGARRRNATSIQAFAATSEGWFRDSRERVLRYPDGVERRIRYPQPSYSAISYPAQGSNSDPDGVYHDPYRSYAEGEDPTRWENFDVASLWDQTSPPRRTDLPQVRLPLQRPTRCHPMLRRDFADSRCTTPCVTFRRPTRRRAHLASFLHS